MKSAVVRALLASFLVLVLAGAWYKPLDRVATEQIDAGLKRALVSFAAARTLNAAISEVQSIQVSAQPFGVGTTFSPLQFLRPINELTSQFAELMLAASIAFGVMKLLIAIGSFWMISLLMSAFALAWGWYRWNGQRVPAWIERFLFVLLFIRFAMPLVTVGTDAVFQKFMRDDYAQSQKAVEGNRDELSSLAPSAAGKGFVERVREWWSKVNQLPWHIVKLIVVFAMQTLVVPLLLLWGLYKAVGALVYPRFGLLDTLGVKGARA